MASDPPDHWQWTDHGKDFALHGSVSMESSEGVDATLDEDCLTVQWTEQSDDYHGTATRTAVVPLAVLVALVSATMGEPSCGD